MTIVSSIPCSICICLSGLITELCSTLVVTTWSPGLTSPRMAMFSACVTFSVKTTLSSEGALNSRFSAALALNTNLPASRLSR
ncbi:MAG: hypothetical protein BWY85_00773 [Firmicutes bacterium ADurb.Bin506]|nr:MAG: hypothetical protein BWY85_00773 [Firmicutes bacterium ADurb.Bin506]